MKKIVAILMAIVICMSNTSSVFAVFDKSERSIPVSFSANATYNERVSLGVLKERSATETKFSESKDIKTMNFNFDSKDNKYYKVSGVITLPHGQKEYNAEGNIEQFLLSNGVVGGIGNLLGTVENETINISIHIIPKQEKIFAYVTVGELAENSKYLTFTYGEMFDEMNELVDLYVSGKKNVIKQEPSISFANITNKAEKASKAADDYNTSYRNIKIGYGQLLNGERVQLAAVTVYTPKRMKSNSNYKSRVKVNGSTDNAYHYVQGVYFVPGALSVWTSSGTCKLNSDDDYVDFSEMDPGNESWNVEIPIPYYNGVEFNWLPWNINIGFSTIKTERSKNSSSSDCFSNALWKHNYSRNVNWSNSGAEATQIGYAGAATTTYYFNRNYNYTTYVYGSGTINYQYSSQFGATSYTGGFSCDTGAAKASIIIDKVT